MSRTYLEYMTKAKWEADIAIRFVNVKNVPRAKEALRECISAIQAALQALEEPNQPVSTEALIRYWCEVVALNASEAALCFGHYKYEDGMALLANAVQASYNVERMTNEEAS